MSFKSICCLLLLLSLPMTLLAQPSRGRVLGDVEISEYSEYVEVRVIFNFPVRYLSHFPAEDGDELRIKLLPIAISRVDREALFQRESLSPAEPNLAGLEEVLYEGDTHAGLYVTFLFQSMAHWQVEQGADYRSLQVRVLSPFPVLPGEVKGE